MLSISPEVKSKGEEHMNPYLQDILHNITTRLAKLEEAQEKKEWVGLTDEEILEEYRQSYGDDGNLTDVYFARAIEAKLKEKNT
jgi:hypothetical protein